MAQQATFDRDVLVKTVDAFQMQFGTAIGSAIVMCLSELFPDHGIRLEDMTFGPRPSSRLPDTGRNGKPSTPPKQITPVEPGSYDAAAIILLSDGRRTMGVDTLQAAKMAADRGVRIHVVGLGTPDGHTASDEGGMGIFMKLDEPTLREVARMTGGEYHRAGTAEVLNSVYQHLGSQHADEPARDRSGRAAGVGGGAAGGGGGVPVADVVRAGGVRVALLRRPVAERGRDAGCASLQGRSACDDSQGTAVAAASLAAGSDFPLN